MRCRASHRYKHTLELSLCPSGPKHVIQEYALLCLNCDKLGDDMSEFKGEICTGQRASEVHRELQAALLEQAKLQCLLELAQARHENVQLMMQKQKGTSIAIICSI